MALYLKDPFEFTGKLYDLINTVKLQEFKINIKNQWPSFIPTVYSLRKKLEKKYFIQNNAPQNWVCRNISNQRSEREIFKKLKTELTQVTRKWKNILCSWIGRINTMKMSIISKILYKINAIPIKIPMIFFTGLEKAIKDATWNHKRSWTDKVGTKLEIS